MVHGWQGPMGRPKMSWNSRLPAGWNSAVQRPEARRPQSVVMSAFNRSVEPRARLERFWSSIARSGPDDQSGTTPLSVGA